MTVTQQIITIALAAAVTVLTRFLPFAVFRNGRPIPKIVEYLGGVLPPAVFAMLVVYCLKGIGSASPELAASTLIAVAAVVALHLAFGKMLLSIAGGTAVYMLMVNYVIAFF